MAVGRCPYPHARIAQHRRQRRARAAGVHDVLTGADVADRTEPIGILRPVPGAPVDPALRARAGRRDLRGPAGRVSVAARSRHIAEDALELIEIDYEPLPHVSDVDCGAGSRARRSSTPDVLESNLLVSNPQGAGDVEARLREADVVVEGRFVVNRVTGLPMETRGVLAEWRPGARRADRARLHPGPRTWSASSWPSRLRLDEGDVRVVASDVGGGFGLKLGVYPEDVLACLHAMTLRRPVKFVEDRIEHFRATTHASRVGARLPDRRALRRPHPRHDRRLHRTTSAA